jgi:hypothetical protein
LQTCSDHRTRIEKALSSLLAKVHLFRRRSAIPTSQGTALVVALGNLASIL